MRELACLLLRPAKGTGLPQPLRKTRAAGTFPIKNPDLLMNRYRVLPSFAPGAVVLILLFAPQISSAAVESPWNLPALSAKPEDILHAAAASPAPTDGDIEMLFEEHVYKLDVQGRQHRILRRVYRFLTDKGVDDWSCTEADWSPWCEEKPIFRVRVITPDGQAHALDQESIGEAPAEQETPNLFSDEKLLRGPLPAIVVGAVVEEEIETREIRSLFDHGIVERFLLAQQYPVRQLRLVIDAPSALPLKYEVIGSDVRPVRMEDNRRTSLVFDLGPLPATESPEDYLPAENAKTPQVVFSTGKSWSDVAAAYSSLVESHLDVDAVRPLVQKATGTETNRDKIVERLLALLRGQIRYTGVEFGKGAIVPRSSRETMARRYGDCKDQATLLVAMLRAAGVRAHVALLRTGRYGDVAPSLPGLGDFDHAIVYIPGDRPMWIDPSARCAPAGYLPLLDQDRWAMLASPETHELIRTERMDYKANTGEQVFELFPLEYGKGRVRSHGDLRRIVRGRSSRRLRLAGHQGLAEAMERLLERPVPHPGLAAIGIQLAVGPRQTVPRHGRGARRADRPVRRGHGHDCDSAGRSVRATAGPVARRGTGRGGKFGQPCRRLAARRAEGTDALAGTAHPAVAVSHPFAGRIHSQGVAGIILEAVRPGNDQPEM